MISRKFQVLYLCLLLSFFVLQSHGQSYKGVVKDVDSGKVLPFVTLKLKGTRLGSIANEFGAFTLNVQEEYLENAVIFSFVGYQDLEVPIAQLNQNATNSIEMKVEVMILEEVVVTDKTTQSPERLLKEVLSKITENYLTEGHTFDAYYREQVTENGVIIKFADASTTIFQKGYNGKPSKSKAMYRELFPLSGMEGGIMVRGMESFNEHSNAGFRFHDHFGHIPTGANRVIVHNSRRSDNLSQLALKANIEGGPLSTLEKDLVMDADLFMRKSMFKQYTYELYEIPTENGDWDYLIKFVPKRAPLSLERIKKVSKSISRRDVLSGSIRIDRSSLAIKQITYRVENDYRRHICSYQMQMLKHYGYEIDIEYKKVSDKWKLASIMKQQEFIVRDTLRKETTSYVTISELKVAEPNAELKTIPVSKSFLNVWSNSLFEYQQPYDSAFWKKYEMEVPGAVINDEMRKELELKTNLENQFSTRGGN